jgi:hypothetical protein
VRLELIQCWPVTKYQCHLHGVLLNLNVTDWGKKQEELKFYNLTISLNNVNINIVNIILNRKQYKSTRDVEVEVARNMIVEPVTSQLSLTGILTPRIGGIGRD